MTSAIGDLVQNPKTNPDSSPSLLARALQGFERGAVSLPDALINMFSKQLGVLTNPLQPEKSQGVFQTDPLDRAMQTIGIVNPNMPKAQSMGEKIADTAGDFLGGMALPLGAAGKGAYDVGKLGYEAAKEASPLAVGLAKSLLGTSPNAVATLPGIAGTAGAIAAPAAAQPVIDETTQNPLAKAALSGATSVAGGGLTGGLANALSKIGNATPLSSLSSSQLDNLPEYTASGNADLNNPNTAKLISKQEDLATTDKKSAQALAQILQNKKSDLLNQTTPTSPVSGDDIVAQIENKFNDLRAQRSTDYQNASNALFADRTQPINVDNTIDALGKAQQDIPKMGGNRSTSLESALNNAFDLVTNNADDPVRLKGALHEIQQMSKPGGSMELSSEQSAVLHPVVKALRNDIDTAYPGFGDLQSHYASQTDALNNLQNGVVGSLVQKGDKNPSQILNQIFEKTDPARVQQLQDVLGPDLYNQAFNSYLSNAAQKTLNAPIENRFNVAPQLQNFGKYLSKNMPSYSATLNPDQQAQVQSLIDQTERSTRGVPMNDFPVQASTSNANSIASLLDTKGKNTFNYIGDVLGNTGINQIATALKRNQMLNGGAGPLGQIAQGMGGTVGRGSVLQHMVPPPLTPQPVQNQANANMPPVNAMQQQPQGSQAPMPIPDRWKAILNNPQNNPSSAFSQFDQKYGLNPANQNAQSQSQMASSFADFDKKYGLNGNQPQNTALNAANNPAQMPMGNNQGALPNDVINYVSNELKKGNTDVLYDPLGSYQATKGKNRTFGTQSDYLNYINDQVNKGNTDVLYNPGQAYQNYLANTPYYQQNGYLDKVKDIIASRESKGSGDYGAQAPNSSAAGKYQFIDSTRNEFAPGVSKEDFLNNPQLQEQAMNKLMQSNMNTFQDAGINLNSVDPSTLAGMLAAAHLRGANAGIAAYQNANYVGEPDANGTTPGNYYNYAVNQFNNMANA